METITKNALFSMFPFLIIRSVNSTFFTEPNLLKKFNLSDTKFCESILSPTEFTLKRSFEATFEIVKKGGYLNESDRADLCCRSFHKCGAHKHIELNYTNEQANIRHCECEYSFKNCLENLNTSSSNVLGFIHSLNTEKCYAIDHPIIECISFDAPQIEPEIDLHLQNLNAVITTVRADDDMEKVFSQQNELNSHTRNLKFGNTQELETYFRKAVNATFSAGCSTYNTFINNMENPPSVTMPESTPADDIHNAEMERTIKLKLIGDKVFRNLLKFLRPIMDVACSNQQLLTSLNNANKDDCRPN
ncbi:uncharacterized protein LOC116340509 [Contarinia nasturtii]|uniref:uncharacterized protein LOC116340509 n=1 Tax=Contarinia nasturtii TaxID=265458 RepID=UPI0012D46A4C|nr:uncharacterized protein LOC116340509 [Contarinia nasturtii]